MEVTEGKLGEKVWLLMKSSWQLQIIQMAQN